MNKFGSTFRLFAVGCLTLIFSAFAAAAPQVYVSSKGNDVNTCDRNAPCATFAGAVLQIDAGGEIVVLDSGSYGAVTIAKSMQIVAPAGVNAVINGSGGSGVTIAAAASDSVVIHGLTISGFSYGINFDSGAALSVENCDIGNSNIGVLFDAPGKLFVRDTIIRKSSYGIYITSSSGAVTQATIERTQVENGYIGFYIFGYPQVSISDSSSSGNSSDGFYIGSNSKVTITNSTAAHNGRWGFAATGGVPTSLTLDGCTAANNLDAGIYGGGGGLPGGIYVRVSNSVSTGNKYGFYAAGYFESYGNNRVRGNTTNTYGTITSVSQN